MELAVADGQDSRVIAEVIEVPLVTPAGAHSATKRPRPDVDPLWPPRFDRDVPVIPCNIGRFAVQVSDQFVGFEPHRATIAVHGRSPRMSDGPGAALIIIANIDVDRVVETLRSEDAHGEDDALVTQRGSLSHKGATEEATRAMIFQSAHETSGAFRARAVATTERLLGRLSVGGAVVELQVRGRRAEVLGIVR